MKAVALALGIAGAATNDARQADMAGETCPASLRDADRARAG